MDIAAIGSALTSVKTAYDIAKGMAELSQDVTIRLKAFELLTVVADVQGKLLESQREMARLQDELRQAQQELAKQADFDRYELVEPYKGTFIFRLKEACRKEGEPIHEICPNCKNVLGVLSFLSGNKDTRYCKNKDCLRQYQVSKPVQQY